MMPLFLSWYALARFLSPYSAQAAEAAAAAAAVAAAAEAERLRQVEEEEKLAKIQAEKVAVCNFF